MAQAGAHDLQEALHIPVLQRLTVSEISALVRGFSRTARPTGRSACTRSWMTLQREHDESEAAAMRKDARLDPLGADAVPRADGTFTHVLLTGGTGFLGPFLLRSLLDRRARPTRSSCGQAIRRRPASGSSRTSRRPGFTIPAPRKPSMPGSGWCAATWRARGLGSRPTTWQQLTESVDTIVHNGAWVDYVLDYDALRPVERRRHQGADQIRLRLAPQAISLHLEHDDLRVHRQAEPGRARLQPGDVRARLRLRTDEVGL